VVLLKFSDICDAYFATFRNSHLQIFKSFSDKLLSIWWSRNVLLLRWQNQVTNETLRNRPQRCPVIKQMAMNWTCVDQSRPQSTEVKENCHVKWEGGGVVGKANVETERRTSLRRCKWKRWVEKANADKRIRWQDSVRVILVYGERESLGPAVDLNTLMTSAQTGPVFNTITPVLKNGSQPSTV
jgi:hypothetical protein